MSSRSRSGWSSRRCMTRKYLCSSSMTSAQCRFSWRAYACFHAPHSIASAVRSCSVCSWTAPTLNVAANSPTRSSILWDTDTNDVKQEAKLPRPKPKTWSRGLGQLFKAEAETSILYAQTHVAKEVVYKWRHASTGRRCLDYSDDVWHRKRVKGSVTSRTSHTWEGTMDSQIHVANLPFVTERVDRETFRNPELSSTRSCT